MNKKFIVLLLPVLFSGAAFASRVNNKTELNTRICRDSVPASTTFCDLIRASKDEDRLGGSFEATGYYGRSRNYAAMAKNFGANGTESVEVYKATATEVNVSGRPFLTTNNSSAWNALLLHSSSASQNNLMIDKATFAPKQTAWGVRLDYKQHLNKWFDGLSFHVSLPFSHVENDINMTTSGGSAGFSAEENISLKTLLKGESFTRTVNATQNAQTTLKYAKMSGNSKTGLGDLGIDIGLNVIKKKNAGMCLNISMIAPTSGNPTGEYLWSARTGDNKWGLGAGTKGNVTMWEKDDQKLRLSGCMQYKYLFSGTEKRTLTLKEMRIASASLTNARNVLPNPVFSQYYLVGKLGTAGIQPLSNVSTLNVKVKPRNQIDSVLCLNYSNGGLTLDAGYNLFWKDSEKLSLKSTWSVNSYAVAKPTCDASAAFNRTNSLAYKSDDLDLAKETIQKADLNLDAASSPSQLVHKAFVGLGYITQGWDYPLMVGMGASYEVPSCKQDAAEGFGLWAKLGFAF
jgi:hypothetical protein